MPRSHGCGEQIKCYLCLEIEAFFFFLELQICFGAIHFLLLFPAGKKIENAEQRFVSEFRRKYGTPEDTVVAIGDWQPHGRKAGKDPRFVKGLARLLQSGGYTVALAPRVARGPV